MSEESKNNIIINNYFHITFENQNQMRNIDLNHLLNLSYPSSLFHPIKSNYGIKSFLSKKRKNIENKIIINEEKEEKSLNDRNIKLSNDKISRKNEIEYKPEDAKKITIEIPNEKPSIFKVENSFINLKKNYGRKPKNNLLKGKHTKYSNDNILRKIKVKFFKKLVKFINRTISKSEFKAKINLIKPLTGSICQNNTIKFNQKLLKLKLKDIFSSYRINKKFKNVGKDYNKDIINKIYEENIKELIDIFEMTCLEAFSIFRDLEETEKLKGLEKYVSVINEMKNKGENEEYLKKFINILQSFENFYFKKIVKDRVIERTS